MTGPRVLLLDGDAYITLSVTRELSVDLDATIIVAGTSKHSRGRRSTYSDIDVVVPPVDDDRYTAAVLELVDTYEPDFVLPVGFRSAAKLHLIRSALPVSVATCLPPQDSFQTAADKVATSQCAERVGLDVPTDYTETVAELDEAGRPAGGLSALEFPVFVKPRWETGGGHTATGSVDSPDGFWELYDRVARGAPGGDVLVQELVTGPNETYGCGLLALDNEIVLRFSHEECRSVPRHGGCGTHLRILRDPLLEQKTATLLREIGWHGLALVEFTKRQDGSYVLLEVNPKFWASYALASRYGYRFGSTMVAATVDSEEDLPIGTPSPAGEMAFPLRELYYYARNRETESLRDTLRVLCQPSVAWSVDRTDLSAWLTPPASVLQGLSLIDRDVTTHSVPEPISTLFESAERVDLAGHAHANDRSEGAAMTDQGGESTTTDRSEPSGPTDRTVSPEQSDWFETPEHTER